MIAKKVHEHSEELEILEYLCQIQPPSPHIITMVDSIVKGIDKWVLVPKMRVYSGPPNISFARYGGEVIAGLAYLHEHGVAHLDIKPDNIVYTQDLHVQIIDFGSAVWISSEDDIVEFEGGCGTRGWKAPEVEGDGQSHVVKFSAIRADRWSCGAVLLDFAAQIITPGCEDLKKFARHLMDNDPRRRPRLLDWLGGRNAVHGDSDIANSPPSLVHESGSSDESLADFDESETREGGGVSMEICEMHASAEDENKTRIIGIDENIHTKRSVYLS